MIAAALVMLVSDPNVLASVYDVRLFEVVVIVIWGVKSRCRRCGNGWRRWVNARM